MARVILIRDREYGVRAHDVEALRGLARGMEILNTPTDSELDRRIGEVEIVFTGIPRELVPRARALRWVQIAAAGAESALKTYPEPVLITNASGVHSVPISEHILALMLAHTRRIPHAVRAHERGVWLPQIGEAVGELAGACLVVVGLGAIGAHLARSSSALGMRVLGVRRDPGAGVPEGVERVVAQGALEDVLPQADFLAITVPHTPRTHGMFGERELRMLKPGAFLVNIGRGKTVREADLVRALREGWLSGAGLDVFEEEPLGADSPLWGMEQVIITAHYSGNTPRYADRLWAIFRDNVARYLEGKPLENVVDRAEGY